MKVAVEKDEWWPVYSLSNDELTWGVRREVPEELWVEWSEIEGRFDEFQEKLRELYEGDT